MQVPLALVTKYNRPGPRYTSYPPAPHFRPDIDAEAIVRLLQEDNLQPKLGPLSLYVHLPFCRSLCYYCGCHMMVTHRPEKIAQYLKYLAREIALVARWVAPERQVVQLHWGGGTPTYLAPAQIVGLMEVLRAHFSFADKAELGIEADPRGLTKAHLEAARQAGFNRISFGVQDLDPKVQQAINRIQPYEQVAEVTHWARELGFESISYDLIYGLPHQQVAQFEQTIRRVIALGPDRISLFSYAHVPWKKKHQRLIQEAWLPSPAEKLQLFLRAVELLTTEGGYRYIGMDHRAWCCAHNRSRLGIVPAIVAITTASARAAPNPSITPKRTPSRRIVPHDPSPRRHVPIIDRIIRPIVGAIVTKSVEPVRVSVIREKERIAPVKA